jgi:hypothetical protein
MTSFVTVSIELVTDFRALTLTTSTGSFFMLFGQVNSGLFSGSPGLSKIFNRFFTSSVRSFAAFESSSRSGRTISCGMSRPCFGVPGIIGEPAMGVFWILLPEFDDVEEPPEVSNKAAAKISAEATTRRSEDV